MDVQTTINQFVAAASAEDTEASNKHAVQLAGLITENSISLLQFIQSLGSTLTSEDDSLRIRGVQCLSQTLTNLDPGKLSKQDVSVLIQFFLSKFDDKPSLVYIFNSLATVVSFKNFVPSINDNLVAILNLLIEKYTPTSHLAKVRHGAFLILNNLFSSHLAYIKASLSTLFAKCFAHVASGEKDPRNLLLSFSLNRNINENLEFGSSEADQDLVADLFDVCFCYFPISFTPPTNDPYKITSKQLSTELRRTIASQSLFAKDSFASLFEKLTSTNPVVRNDVLKCLLLCVQSYSLATVEEYWLTIWNALKFELLHNDMSVFSSLNSSLFDPQYDEKMEDSDDNKSLVLTLVILKRLATVAEKQNNLESFLVTITDELKKNVSTISDKSFLQSVVLLSALASVSPDSYNYIFNFVLSHEIWGKFIRSDSGVDIEDLEADMGEDLTLNVAKQRTLVDNLGFFLAAYQDLLKVDSSFSEQENALSTYKDHLLIFMGQLLQASSNIEKTLKCKTIQQLIKLISIPNLLHKQDYTLVFSWLNENLRSTINYNSKTWENDLVLQEIKGGLINLMSQPASIQNTTATETSVNSYVTLVIELIFPTLLELLDNVDYPDGIENFRKVLEILNSLCVNYQVLEVLTIRLLNKLTSYKHSEMDIDSKRTLIKDILNSFITSFKKTQCLNQFLTNSWYKNFLPRFLPVIFSMHDKIILELSSILVGLIIRFIEKSKHQQILNDFVGLFILEQNQFNISMPSVISDRSSYIGVFNSVLANVDRSADIEEALGYSVDELIDKTTRFCYSSDEDEYIRLGYLQSMCVLTNKFTTNDDEYNNVSLGSLLMEISAYKDDLTKEQIETFEVFVWKLKALILRVDKLSFEYVNQLLELLSSPNYSLAKLASESFNIVMVDLSIFVNESMSETQEKSLKKVISGVNNLNVKMLYKQRLFQVLLPKLVEGYAQESHQELYLLTLSVVLNNIPATILKSNLRVISPLVLTSLSMNNSVILLASLSALRIIINEDAEILTPHLSTVIPKLLELVATKKMSDDKLVNTEEIRLLSLHCLGGIFSKMQVMYVVPFQKQAIRELSVGLDDKKRSVRKLSCDVRQVLYELGRL